MVVEDGCESYVRWTREMKFSLGLFGALVAYTNRLRVAKRSPAPTLEPRAPRRAETPHLQRKKATRG